MAKPIFVPTYKLLRRHCQAFAEGKFESLIIVGPPGVGKSTALAGLLPDFPTEADGGPSVDEMRKRKGHARWINSRATGIQVYANLYRYRDAPIIFDDVDQLYKDKQAVAVLKAATDSRRIRKVAWHSTSRELSAQGIPREFDTKSQVCIVANEWEGLDKNLGALEDRGILLRFAPPPAEVHIEAGNWFKDEAVYEFIGERLGRIHQHSQRLYVHAQKFRKAKLDWKSWIEEQIQPPDHLKILDEIRNDAGLLAESERFARFHSLTGMSRATYFRYVAELRDRDRAAGLIVARRARPRRAAKGAAPQAVEITASQAEEAAHPVEGVAFSQVEGVAFSQVEEVMA
ncbi:ATP-binding protein [Tundrisphaera sp. TA3]|uniref:ATP-binding protein n=1 Tax=Tundrisphaera sp. TA3 TaxID=3435775 RepID=UPI003EBADB19